MLDLLCEREKARHKTPSHRKHRAWRVAWLASLALGFWLSASGPLESVAWGQNKQTAFQLQRFRPWADPQGMFETQSAKTLGQWNYLVALYLNYAKDPLTYRLDANSRTSVVGHQLGADILLGVGLLPWLDVYLAVPMTIYQAGRIPDETFFDARNTDLSGYAFSDMKFSVKAQALHEKKHFLDLGAQLFLGLPTGNDSNFNGEGGVSFGLRIFANKQISIVRLALNLGYRYLPRTEVLNLVINHEITYSLGANVTILPGKLDAIGEISGATALKSDVALEDSPFDLYVGARYYPLRYKDLALSLGFGFPLFWPGYGSPQFRVLLGVVWAPKNHDKDKDGVLDHNDRCIKVPGPKANQGCPWPDTDSDGLTDNIDKCPKKPGPKENKGCPWPDTDKDGLTDNIDKCPKKFGPKANKGCPWPDTDKDGLTDNIDKCPKKRGPKENKGCPWPDTDKDGLTDNIDKCPQKPGPKENKGCPDTDRDGDTVIDRKDKCPDVPGDPERNGCPKKVLVVVTKKAIKILQKVYFRSGRSRIYRRSYAMLKQVSQVLKSRPKIRIRIEGHTDNRGGKKFNLRLSQKRADAVRKFLIKQGIDQDRMIAKGFGMSQPIDSNKTRKGRAKNRRVEFNITSQ